VAEAFRKAMAADAADAEGGEKKYAKGDFLEDTVHDDDKHMK